MAKFYGKIGYAISSEDSPGIWKNTYKERSYQGDLNSVFNRYDASNNVIDDFKITNEISIVADSFAYENLGRIRYVVFRGEKWKVNSVEEAFPRLVLRIGGLFNG